MSMYVFSQQLSNRKTVLKAYFMFGDLFSSRWPGIRCAQHMRNHRQTTASVCYFQVGIKKQRYLSQNLVALVFDIYQL